MPSISIIIPTYNMHKQLVRCLGSVDQQTMKPDEVTVVDDGSTDGTSDVVGAIHELPVHVIRQEHAGASAARNRGFAESKGDYMMFLDADVVLKKHALERLLETLRQASSFAKAPEDRQGDTVGYAYSAFKWGWKKFTSFPFDAERLRQMPFIHATSLLKRNVLPEKPFDESLKRLQDWDLYLTLRERGVAGVYIPEILFSVDTGGTMSRWLPAVMYQIPFSRYGVKVSSLEKYYEAEKRVKEKHGIRLGSNLE